MPRRPVCVPRLWLIISGMLRCSCRSCTSFCSCACFLPTTSMQPGWPCLVWLACRFLRLPQTDQCPALTVCHCLQLYIRGESGAKRANQLQQLCTEALWDGSLGGSVLADVCRCCPWLAADLAGCGVSSTCPLQTRVLPPASQLCRVQCATTPPLAAAWQPHHSLLLLLLLTAAFWSANALPTAANVGAFPTTTNLPAALASIWRAAERVGVGVSRAAAAAAA